MQEFCVCATQLHCVASLVLSKIIKSKAKQGIEGG